MATLSPEQRAELARDDQGPLTKSIVLSFTIIAFISVSVRLFARFSYQNFGSEDYTIAISTIASVGMAVCQVLQVHAGNGKHAVLIESVDQASQIIKFLFFSIIAYNLSLTFTKISILLQYHRIFTLREMRMPIRVVLGICIAWGIVTLFTSTLSCFPVKAYWDIANPSAGHCINRTTLWYANASINIVTDLMIAMLPVRSIWALQIPKQQKIALLVILTIGWFVCVVSILRLRALVVLAQHPEDATWYSAPTAYWSAIEANLAIVCASLPALKPLIVRVIPAFSTWRASSRGYSSTSASSYSHRLHKLGSKDGSQAADHQMGNSGNSSHIAALPSRSFELDEGRNILVTQHIEQHFERNHEVQGRNSDSESQKEFVASSAESVRTNDERQ